MMIAPFALLAAALFTRSLGTFITVPDWQPTAPVDSCYHAYGTFSGGSGSTEFYRATSNSAAAVNALFDGAYERAWLGRDYGLTVVSNGVSGVITNLYAQLSGDWKNCYAVDGSTVGVNDPWEANEPRVVTNSFRLLSWTNLTRTATSLARKNHLGWAAKFGGAALRSAGTDIEPPLGSGWVQTFPCCGSVTAANWVDVFPVFSMLEEDDGSMYYECESTYPRDELRKWLTAVRSVAGDVGDTWIDGGWTNVVATPYLGPLAFREDQPTNRHPLTVAGFYALDVPAEDSHKLSRHYDFVVDVYSNVHVTVSNSYTEFSRPMSSNILYHVCDLSFDVRDGSVTNNIRRHNMHVETNTPVAVTYESGVVVITNKSPASQRLDWYKAGALNRFEADMTSTYASTNDLHLFEGRDEIAVTDWAYTSNNVTHGYSFYIDADGNFEIETNAMSDIEWCEATSSNSVVWATNRTDRYHPTFRVAAQSLEFTASAEFRRSFHLTQSGADYDASKCISGEEVSTGSVFVVKGTFFNHLSPRYWFVEYDELMLGSQTNASTNVIHYVSEGRGPLGVKLDFPKELAEVKGNLAKSARALIFDRFTTNAVLSVDPGGALAKMMPPQSLWDGGYATASHVYVADSRIATDEYPVFRSDSLVDPSDDAKAGAISNAVSSGFRISNYGGSSALTNAVETIMAHHRGMTGAVESVVSEYVEGRSMSSAAWTKPNTNETAKFNELKWLPNGEGYELETPDGSPADGIGLAGHIEMKEIGWDAVVDEVRIYTDRAHDIYVAAPITNEAYAIGYHHVYCNVDMTNMPAMVEIRGGKPWKRGSQFQVDVHSLPMFRTDWKWKCLTPTD